MNRFLIALLSVAALNLVACDKKDPVSLPDDPAIVPVPKSSGSTMDTPSIDEGIDHGTKQESSGDEAIQSVPVKPDGDPAIIIPPPKADMPPEIVPDKP